MQRKPTRQNRYRDIERERADRSARASRAARRDATVESASRASRRDAAAESASRTSRRDAYSDETTQKIKKIFIQEDGQEIPLDHTSRRQKRAARSYDLPSARREANIDAAPSSARRASNTDLARPANRRNYSDENLSSYGVFDDAPYEDMSYHEERMARKAARAAEGKTSRKRASGKRSSRTRFSDNRSTRDLASRDRSSRDLASRDRSTRDRASRDRSSRKNYEATRRQLRPDSVEDTRRITLDDTKRIPVQKTQPIPSREEQLSAAREEQLAARAEQIAAAREEQLSATREEQLAARAEQIAAARAAARDARQTSGPEAAPRQRVRDTSEETPRQRKQRRSGGQTRQKKLLQIIVIAALIVVAAIIALIIIFSGTKEASDLKLTSTDTTQTLSWERTGKDVGYEVLQKTSDGSYQVVKTVSAEGGTSVTIEGLSSATLYEYKVRAYKDSEHPKKTSGVTIKGYTAPSVLTDLTASTQVKESLTFVWSDTQPVAGFELRYGSSEDFSDAAIVTLTSENIVIDEGNGKNTYTLENQPEGTKYYYSMRSFCDENSYSVWTTTATARVTRPVDMHGIDVNAPMVAITFDDGPDVSNITSRILDAFAAVGGHATFFQLGERAEMYPEKIQRIVNEGHEIANHTYDHSHMGDAVTSEDIISANDAIEAAGGVRPVSFRSPGGNTTELIRQTCLEENMALYYWSMDTRDWYTKDAEETVSYIKSHVEDGDIILMHNIYDSSAEAIEQILPWLSDQGYQLVTVSQLLVAKTGGLPEPGVEYVTATKTLDR